MLPSIGRTTDPSPTPRPSDHGKAARVRSEPPKSSLSRNHDSLMALGFVAEQQQQQQLLARVPIAALPKPGVGDAASAALNAAALQTLSMKQAEQQYRLYRGQIMYGRAGILLDGVHSHDVSYIADAPSQAAGGGNRSRVSDPRAGAPGGVPSGAPSGEPANTSLSHAELAARELRELREHRDRRDRGRDGGDRGGGGGGGSGLGKSKSARHRGERGEAHGGRTEHEPSSRAQAVAAADHLRRALLELPGDVELDEEMDLWNGAFGEVVRQVHVHCNERGSLLEAIRIRYSTVVDRLLRDRAAELAALQQKHAHASDAEDESRKRRTKHAMMFARAAHDSKTTTLQGEVAEGDRRYSDAVTSARIETDQLRARLDVTAQQLAEARRRIQELLDAQNALSAEQIYASLCRLESHDEQRELLHRALLRPTSQPRGGGSGDDDDEPSEVCAPLLPLFDFDDQLSLLLHLLHSLKETSRLELLHSLCQHLLPKLLHELCGRAMLEHITGAFADSSHGKVKPRHPEHAALAIVPLLTLYVPPDGGALGAAEAQALSSRRVKLCTTLFEGVGKPIETKAPELHTELRRLMPQPVLAPPNGEDPSAWYQQQIAQLNQQLATRDNEIGSLREDNNSLAMRLKQAEKEIGRLRLQLQAQLAASGDMAEAAAMAADEGGSGDGSGGGEAAYIPFGASDGEAKKNAAGLKMTTVLMRTYREELKVANARIAELEALLREQQAKFDAELSKLRGELAQKDAAMAKLQSEMEAAKKEAQQLKSNLKNCVCQEVGGGGGGGRGSGQQAYDSGTHGGSAHGEGSTHGQGGTHGEVGTQSGGGATGRKGSKQPAPPATSRQGGPAGRRQPGAQKGKAGSVPAEPSAANSGGGEKANAPPQLGKRNTMVRDGVPLGSCILDAGAKPMSTTFLFRLIANLVSSKVVADERVLLAGRQPLSFPDFVSYQMITFYGVKKFATRYLQEMYVGLVKKRTQHPRLNLFARALQVFPEEPGKALQSEAFVLVTTFLRTTLYLMESEKAVTKTTSVSFFANYGQMCTCYVPIDYLRRAVPIAHHSDTNAPVDKVAEFVESFLREPGGGLSSVFSCNIHASSYEYTKRAAVHGEQCDDAVFADFDLFLAKLATFYEDLLTGNQRRLDDMFRQFDVDGDGHISFDEFQKLLASIHDMEAHPMTVEQIRQMYDALNVQGDGTIAHDDLMDMLRVLNNKERASDMVPTNLEVQAVPEAEADSQLRELTAGWDQVRATTSAEDPDEATERFFCANIKAIMKIQVIWKYRLKKMRGNKPSGICLSALGFW